MSIHKSLSAKGRLRRQRNVLSRLERIEKLEEEGRWSDDESIFGLPKVRVARVRRGTKKKAKEKEDASAESKTAPEKRLASKE